MASQLVLGSSDTCHLCLSSVFVQTCNDSWVSCSPLNYSLMSVSNSGLQTAGVLVWLIPSSFIRSCLVPSHPILSYSISSYPIPYHPIPFHSIPFCPVCCFFSGLFVVSFSYDNVGPFFCRNIFLWVGQLHLCNFLDGVAAVDLV